MDKKKILIVDDDVDLLRIFKNYFEHKDFYVDTAADGETALKKLEGSVFDLMILDVKLPNVSGDEVVRRVRLEANDMEIVMITGYPDLQHSIDILDYGIHTILLKPVTLGELLKVTCEALALPMDELGDTPCLVASPAK